METKTYTVPISNIDSIQLNLFDFIPEGISKNEYIESKIEERINSKPDLDVDNSKWALNDYNNFSYVNPVCPKCGSKKINKKGSVKRNKQGIDRNEFNYRLQTYECKKCKHRFTTHLDFLNKKHKCYINDIREKIKSIIEIGYVSLRNIAKYLEITCDIKISHQTISNILAEESENEQKIIDFEIKNPEAEYSGYYTYDEQYLQINGIKHFRLTLYDVLYNIPLAEKIAPHRNYKTTKTFLDQNLKDKPCKAITTDLLPMYDKIINKTNVKHHLCNYHLFSLIDRITYKQSIKTFMSESDKRKIKKNAHELKECFCKETVEEVKKAYQTYLRKIDNIPKPLEKFCKTNINKNFNKYTNHLKDKNIPKTSNTVENYYRQTNPDQIKKRYKTKKGILTFLTYKMKYWTKNFKKNYMP